MKEKHHNFFLQLIYTNKNKIQADGTVHCGTSTWYIQAPSTITHVSLEEVHSCFLRLLLSSEHLSQNPGAYTHIKISLLSATFFS